MDLLLVCLQVDLAHTANVFQVRDGLITTQVGIGEDDVLAACRRVDEGCVEATVATLGV